MTLDQQFKAAMRVSTPLVVVRTPDPAATVSSLSVIASNGKNYPTLRHDQVSGLTGINGPGKEVALTLRGTDPPDAFADPMALLFRLADDTEPPKQEYGKKAQPSRPPVPERTTIFMVNAHWAFADPLGHAIPNATQGVLNIRDTFKLDHRMLVLLVPYGWRVPQEMAGSVSIFDEAMPSEEQLTTKVTEIFKDVNMAVPDPPTMSKIVDTISGVPMFPAEQMTSQALTKAGVDQEMLWTLKTAQVETTRGVRIYRGGDGFKALGGLSHAIDYCRRVINGKRPPRAVLWMDEIEKAVAGFKGDLSGISQDAVGHLLTWIVEIRALCLLLYGHPGTGKSALAKAIGQEAGAVTLAADMGAMTGSLVGESQGYIRAFTKMAEAISRGQILIVATCNDVAPLPTEFMSRFQDRFFVELPDDEEKKAIWSIKLAQYGLDPKIALPNDDLWTGREIEQCCEKAWMWDITPSAAAAEVVPIALTDPEAIAERRRRAHNAFKDASRPGVYTMTRNDPIAPTVAPHSRAIDVPPAVEKIVFPGKTKES